MKNPHRDLLFSLQSVSVLEAAWLGVSSLYVQQLASLPAAERAKVTALAPVSFRELPVIHFSLQMHWESTLQKQNKQDDSAVLGHDVKR